MNDSGAGKQKRRSTGSGDASEAGSTPEFELLASRIANRTSTVGVIGLGYVGLPLVKAFEKAGHNVVGFDVDPAKIEALAAGESYVAHLPADFFAELAASDRFLATADTGMLGDCDVVVVCVPTPLGSHREPDLSYVTNAGRQIGEAMVHPQLVVLESTTYPGTTRREFADAIVEGMGGRARALQSGLFVAYSPEREDPGRAEDSMSIPKLVGGLGGEALTLAVDLYDSAFETVVPVDSPEIAEASKLLENIFRATNIALVNEMKVVLQKLDIDIWDVVKAASTKPFGYMPFYPGPGLGGHCIPIDPFYLTWRAREIGEATQFIELAGLINTRMPEYVIDRLAEALNERRIAVNGAKVLVIGLAYKPDVSDTRDSPTFELLELLAQRGAEIAYHDPFIARTTPVRGYDFDLESVDITAKNLKGFDAVLISTAHSSIDYELIAEHSSVVVDTRNVMAPMADKLGERLVKA